MAKRQKNASNMLEVQNAAKTMFANLRFQSIDRELKSILITSSVPDEGKSTTAWYLAQAAATAGNLVLLIEADMRRRSLANMLQLHPPHGIFSVLSGSVSLDAAVARTPVANLLFLDSEPSIPNPADLLASKRMERFNEQLMKRFDYVIYDTPPVGTFVDAAALGRTVDGAILVARPGRVKRQELLLAHEQLASAGTNVVGICATFVEGTGSEYYYSYYTKGSHGKGKGKAHGSGKDVAPLDAASFATSRPALAVQSSPAPSSAQGHAAPSKQATATQARQATRAVQATQAIPETAPAHANGKPKSVSVPRTGAKVVGRDNR